MISKGVTGITRDQRFCQHLSPLVLGGKGQTLNIDIGRRLWHPAQMPRPPRLEFPGAIYHASARGNERRPIFRSAKDRQHFLELLEATRLRFGFVIHGFCLMPNHFHLIGQTPTPNLGKMMAWLLTSYTVWFNRRHQRAGHLFQGRYKAFLVDADAYAKRLLLYVHANPARTIVAKSQAIQERWKILDNFPWSSHPHYSGRAASKVVAVCTEWLRYWGESTTVARNQYRKALFSAIGTTQDPLWEKVRAGMALGDDSFLRRVRSLLEGKPGEAVRPAGRKLLDDHSRQELGDQIAKIHDQRVRIWSRVNLLGETQTSIAKELGYADGSTVSHLLTRLSQETKTKPALAKTLHDLRQLASEFKV